MTSKINRKLVTEQKENSLPFTRPYKRIVSRYVTFELFSRPPSPIFHFPMHTRKYAEHKKCAPRNFGEKFTAKGNWAEKLILTLSDAFCLNFCPTFSGPKVLHPSSVPVQFGFIFGPFWRQTRSLFLALPFALSNRNLVRGSFLLFWALFACSFRNRLFSFFSLTVFIMEILLCKFSMPRSAYKAIGTREQQKDSARRATECRQLNEVDVPQFECHFLTWHEPRYTKEVFIKFEIYSIKRKDQSVLDNWNIFMQKFNQFMLEKSAWRKYFLLIGYSAMQLSDKVKSNIYSMRALKRLSEDLKLCWLGWKSAWDKNTDRDSLNMVAFPEMLHAAVVDPPLSRAGKEVGKWEMQMMK